MFDCSFCFANQSFSIRKRLALWVQSFIFVFSIQSHAFISEVLEVKKEIAGYSLILESASDILEDMDKFKGIESEYQAYEKELREFQKTLNEYESLGLDVRDLMEMRNYNPHSIRGQIDFFKNYVRRADRLLKSFQSLTGSPEAVIATEQMETNRTLRALLEDSQTRELRKLRREIASERIRLERKKQEREFLNRQYAYINRHSRRSGFGIFHPFRNSKDREEKPEKRKKKFLGIF